MARHPNQSKGIASYQPIRARHDVGHTDAATVSEDVAKFNEITKTRLKKPPHRHRFVDAKCTVCGEPEVEST